MQILNIFQGYSAEIGFHEAHLLQAGTGATAQEPGLISFCLIGQ